MLHGDAARAALLRGVDRMVRLMAPTLGPTPRTVAVARVIGGDPPEVLDSGATIARRTIELVDPFEDMGGMLIRNLVWQVFERVGDGTTTAGVLARAVLHEASQHVAAGAIPVLLRRGRERGMVVARGELERQARPIKRQAEIAAVVSGSLGDAALADMLAEVT